MNILYKHIKLITVITVILCAIPYHVTQASDLPSARENLINTTNRLIEARDAMNENTLSKEKEIAHRRSVTLEAVNVTLKEIESVRERLKLANIDTETSLIDIRKIIIQWLDDEQKHFQSIEQKLLVPTINIEEIQDIAREIRAYRDSEYNTKLANALDVIFTLETLRLINTAENRWNRINTDIQRLERNRVIQRGLFNNEMMRARQMIDGAEALSSQAIDLIKNIYAPAPTTIELLEVVEINTTEEKIKSPSIRELCESAIVNLRSSYGEFMRISNAVRRLLKR